MQVLLAPGEDIATQCLAADVMYGDIPLGPGQVVVTTAVQPGESTGTARIVSASPVNEPIVTLSVRAGCGLPFTRRYVLLADLVSEPATAPVAVVQAPAPAPAPVRAPAPAPAVAPPSPPPVVRARPPAPPKPSKIAVAPRSKPLPPPAPERDSNAPAPAVAAAPAPAAAPTGAPRLRLDPPDLSSAGSPVGMADTPAAAPVEPNPLETALATANAEVQRNTERLAALEAEMAKFREAQQRDQMRIAELNAKLALAQEQRYANWLVYVLGGLLLLALGAVVMLARRQRRDAVIASDASRAWWAEARDDDDDVEQMPPRNSRRAPLQPSAPVPLEPLDVDLDIDSTPAALEPEPAPRSAAPIASQDRRDFAPSALGVSRSVATEELFDVQQQADFFVSLGEDEQAITVLRNHLTESHEPSPLAYLDLFRLYHRLGRREDYAGLREEFNRVFNAGAPEFDRYTDKGRGLEAYETAFARIQALWPQPRVLDLIERSIFRDSEEGETEVFDLEAYRELLMLHSVAKDIVERESATQPPVDFQNTNMQPLKAAAKPVAAAPVGEDAMRRTVPMDLHVIPPASPRVALDVNIEDLEAESQFEASLPEVDVPVEPTAGRSHAYREGESMIDFEIVENDPPKRREGSDPTDDLPR
ncbi:MAG: hypothetical protein KF871_10095 [Hydrogenophaga sp.]|uniref:hypothetical protein n=1 Tax=Hydrogenophaga sp. TaxID=1904254 RepID=UPI001D1F8EBB|nr:hypothetical protein [Hydrogenophaga sp.]MBX3610237.1 hypothetical protein [Hydrogenophaga sp.]